MSNTELLLTQGNELLLHIYTAQLFAIAVGCSAFVIFLLYKFLRKFY